MADDRMKEIALAVQECVVSKGEDRVRVRESKRSITVKVRSDKGPVDYKIIIMED